MSAVIRKTKLCVNYSRDGSCRYGAKCAFAHGEAELVVRPRKVVPCWFHNNGGCTKTDDQCRFDHVIATVRKPLFLQRPCRWYHYETPRQCRAGDHCKWDHSYELTEKEWRHHFEGLRYPGRGYLAAPVVAAATAQQRVEIDIDDEEAFPTLVIKAEPVDEPETDLATKLMLLADRLKSNPKLSLSQQSTVEDAIAVALKEMIA